MADTVLITGASSGIGEALAQLFARDGHTLVLVARSEDKLRRFAEKLRADHNIRVEVIAADLTVRTAINHITDALEARDLEVDFLVNNAGVADFGQFADRPHDDLVGMVDLNIRALLSLTRTLVPGMVKRKKGGILNVASVAGFQPTPGYAVYGATKAFVLSLSESLAEELRQHNITVTAMCPGLVDTPLVDKVAAHNSAAAAVPSQVLLDVNKVAEEGYKAFKAGEVVVVNGLAYKAMTNFTRYNPRWLVRRAMGLANRVAGL